MSSPLEILHSALVSGDAAAASGAFSAQGVVDDPFEGRIAAAAWVGGPSGWLAAARPTAMVRGEQRHALELRIDRGGRSQPVLMVGNADDDGIEHLRIYTSPRNQDDAARGPLVAPRGDRVPSPAADLILQIGSAATEEVAELCEANADIDWGGRDRLQLNAVLAAAGGPVFVVCSATHEDSTTVLEYVVEGWGGYQIPAQAGAVSIRSSEAGKVASATFYDEVRLPAELARHL